MGALTVLLAIYAAPLIVAAVRGHRQILPIGALNVLLGWTVVGWVAALVWALTTDTSPTPATLAVQQAETRTCPRCAETIKRAASICRFCGHAVDPLPAINPYANLPSYSDPEAKQRPKPLSFE